MSNVSNAVPVASMGEIVAATNNAETILQLTEAANFKGSSKASEQISSLSNSVDTLDKWINGIMSTIAAVGGLADGLAPVVGDTGSLAVQGFRGKVNPPGFLQPYLLGAYALTVGLSSVLQFANGVLKGELDLNTSAEEGMNSVMGSFSDTGSAMITDLSNIESNIVQLISTYAQAESMPAYAGS